jgi:hypothetical protein
LVVSLFFIKNSLLSFNTTFNPLSFLFLWLMIQHIMNSKARIILIMIIEDLWRRLLIPYIRFERNILLLSSSWFNRPRFFELETVSIFQGMGTIYVHCVVETKLIVLEHLLSSSYYWPICLIVSRTNPSALSFHTPLFNSIVDSETNT